MACVAKGRIVDLCHSEIVLGHNLITIDDGWHLFVASAFELGLSPQFHINLACDVAAQEEGARVPEIGSHRCWGVLPHPISIETLVGSSSS